MFRNILAGTTALALVVAFATGAAANPENKFGDSNTATASATASATANGADGAAGGSADADGGIATAGTAGAGGAGGAGGTATAYGESFNSSIEVISVQELTAI